MHGIPPPDARLRRSAPVGDADSDFGNAGAPRRPQQSRRSVKDHQLRSLVMDVDQHDLGRFGEAGVLSVEMYRPHGLESVWPG